MTANVNAIILRWVELLQAATEEEYPAIYGVGDGNIVFGRVTHDETLVDANRMILVSPENELTTAHTIDQYQNRLEVRFEVVFKEFQDDRFEDMVEVVEELKKMIKANYHLETSEGVEIGTAVSPEIQTRYGALDMGGSVYIAIVTAVWEWYTAF